jgi:hypothetical protein
MPGGVSARATPFSLTEVPRPTVKADGWPEAMPANDDCIRCAILTGERRDSKGRYADSVSSVIVVAMDGRALEAVRWNNGWMITLSHDGRTVHRVAARHGSKHDRPTPASFLGRVFAGKEMFSWQETEDIMKQFVTSPGDPASVSWVGKGTR